MEYLQGSASVWPSAVAGILRSHFRCLHQVVEVPAATSHGAGLQVWPEALADRRNSKQDWPALLSLLVSMTGNR